MSSASVAARAQLLAALLGGVLGALPGTAIYVGLGISVAPVAAKIPMGNEVAVLAFAAFGAMAGLRAPSGAAAGS
jgi:hypothetical protein